MDFRTRRLKWNEGYWPPGLGRPGTLIFWDISRDMGGIQESWDIIASIPYVPWSKLWYMVFGLPSHNWRPLRAYNFLWYNELMIVPFMDQKPCVDYGMWFFRHVVFLEWRCQTCVLESKWWSFFPMKSFQSQRMSWLQTTWRLGATWCIWSFHIDWLSQIWGTPLALLPCQDWKSSLTRWPTVFWFDSARETLPDSPEELIFQLQMIHHDTSHYLDQTNPKPPKRDAKLPLEDASSPPTLLPSKKVQNIDGPKHVSNVSNSMILLQLLGGCEHVQIE